MDLLRDGEKVGYVTSTAYSPRLERNIGVGMVPAHMAGGAHGLTAAMPDGARPVEITRLPFLV